MPTGGVNKTRKLEFLMAEALEQGCDTILTCGAVQSNHCRLTLQQLLQRNGNVVLVLEERVAQIPKHPAITTSLFNLLGVEAVRVVPGGTDMLGALNQLADELRAQGRKPYVVPGGGSNPLGAPWLCILRKELQQSFDMGVNFDHIICSIRIHRNSCRSVIWHSGQ